MKLDIYQGSLAGQRSQSKVLGVVSIVLSAALLLCVFKLVNIHERIVVVPPGLSGPVAIDWGRADAEYLKTFGLFYATLLGTITPRNAEYVADRLSGMTAPNAYAKIRKQILAIGKDPAFVSSGSTSNFVANNLVHEIATGKVFVIGENQTYSGFGAPKVTPVVYEIDAVITEGRPVVNSIVNYPGTDARTIEWKTTHPGWNAEATE